MHKNESVVQFCIAFCKKSQKQARALVTVSVDFGTVEWTAAIH